jgi:cytochrome c oxidase subunit 3
MAVAAAGHGSAAGHVTHNSLAMKRVGLWMFFASESFLFALIGTSRFFLEGFHADELNQQLGFTITIVLLLSSVTAYTAETAMEHDRRGLFFVGFALTILLGLVFAVGVGFEWSIAHFSRKDIFGTVFFTMTGLHASHVISGIGLLTLVLIQAARGRVNSKDHWPVSGVVMYWHFVDVVWVFYYPALYLVQGVK